MQTLNGKHVVVTGGSEGLGLAILEALVASAATDVAYGLRANSPIIRLDI